MPSIWIVPFDFFNWGNGAQLFSETDRIGSVI